MSKVILDLASLRTDLFRTNTSKLVLFCLLRDVGEDGIVRTSASSIAKEMGVCEKTIRKVLSAFSEYGVIEYEGPMSSPNKVRYLGKVIKLNILNAYDEKQRVKVRTKSDTKSDMVTNKTSSDTLINYPLVPTSQSSEDFSTFADTFNSKVRGTSIPTIRGLSDARKRAVRNLAKEYGGIEVLATALDRVIASDFLCGRKKDFRATFDWIFTKKNFIKILEGNYDNNPIQPTYTSDGRKIDQYSELENAANAVLRRAADIFAPGYD